MYYQDDANAMNLRDHARRSGVSYESARNLMQSIAQQINNPGLDTPKCRVNKFGTFSRSSQRSRYRINQDNNVYSYPAREVIKLSPVRRRATEHYSLTDAANASQLTIAFGDRGVARTCEYKCRADGAELTLPLTPANPNSEYRLSVSAPRDTSSVLVRLGVFFPGAESPGVVYGQWINFLSGATAYEKPQFVDHELVLSVEPPESMIDFFGSTPFVNSALASAATESPATAGTAIRRQLMGLATLGDWHIIDQV